MLTVIITHNYYTHPMMLYTVTMVIDHVDTECCDGAQQRLYDVFVMFPVKIACYDITLSMRIKYLSQLLSSSLHCYITLLLLSPTTCNINVF